MALARLAALFLEHRTREGFYAESLGSLNGAQRPSEPLPGKPFQLKRESGAWILFSAGDNQISWLLKP